MTRWHCVVSTGGGFYTAHEFAILSNYGYKMSAIIMKGGNILSVGYNRVGGHPEAYYGNSFHAEHDAIRKCSNQETLRGAKMYVYRFGRGTHAASSSKPCSGCQEKIHDTGLSRVVFVDENNTICRESFKRIPRVAQPHLRHIQFGTTACYFGGVKR